MRMGSGHEVRNFTMPESGELFWVYGFQDVYCNAYKNAFEVANTSVFVPSTELCDRIHTASKIYKSINVDQHGQESISFTDIDGKLLATCLSGQENEANVHTQHVSVTIQPGEYTDIHIPQGCEGVPVVHVTSSGTTIRVEDINTNFTDVTDGFFSSSSIGYFRIYNDKASPNYVTIDYDLNYYNFALYYYDDGGRLIASVPPEGVDYSATPQANTTALVAIC